MPTTTPCHGFPSDQIGIWGHISTLMKYKQGSQRGETAQLSHLIFNECRKQHKAKLPSLFQSYFHLGGSGEKPWGINISVLKLLKTNKVIFCFARNKCGSFFTELPIFTFHFPNSLCTCDWSRKKVMCTHVQPVSNISLSWVTFKKVLKLSCTGLTHFSLMPTLFQQHEYMYK